VYILLEIVAANDFIWFFSSGWTELVKKPSMKVALVSDYSSRVSMDGSGDEIGERMAQPWKLFELG